MALHRKFRGPLRDRFTPHREDSGMRLAFSRLNFFHSRFCRFHSFYPTDDGSPADHLLFSQSQITAYAGGR